MKKVLTGWIGATALWATMGLAVAMPTTTVVVEKGTGSDPTPVVTNLIIFGQVEAPYWTTYDPRALVVGGSATTFQWTFCIEPFVDDSAANFRPGQQATFQQGDLLGRVRTDSQLPGSTPSYLTSQTSVDYIETLWGSFYNSLLVANNPYQTRVNVAAFQVLVWEFALDATTFNLSTGNIIVDPSLDTTYATDSTNVKAQAQNWLTQIVSGTATTKTTLAYYDGVPGGSSNGGQAQGYIGVPPVNNGDPPLPLPAIPALLAVGVLALAASRRK
jgi:hypothetical protein